ncbi:MAG TPA: sigma-70 family RNA polymerase sigma factor [Candidatus Acidoferrales bacterium]|nr:sigma-70 family RNA polymerase sigma factor [Candidatus Acidoferrales bacterium]
MVSMIHAGAHVLRLPHSREQTSCAVRFRQDEFDSIAMPHSRSLLRVARRLTLDPGTAEDLVQETLFLAWRGFDQFQRGTNARAWLFRILFNAFYGQGRKLRSTPQIISLDASESDTPAEIPAAISHIDAIEVSNALHQLSEEHRTVLLLGVVEGFTCEEMSRILSIPIGTVMSRLSRARQALRAILAPAARGSLGASETRAHCAHKEAS